MALIESARFFLFINLDPLRLFLFRAVISTGWERPVKYAKTCKLGRDISESGREVPRGVVPHWRTNINKRLWTMEEPTFRLSSPLESCCRRCRVHTDGIAIYYGNFLMQDRKIFRKIRVSTKTD